MTTTLIEKTPTNGNETLVADIESHSKTNRSTQSQIQIYPSATTRIHETDWENLGFGAYFSDHMFVADFINNEWMNPRVVPYGKIEIEPSLCALHYGQAVFEGLKAFARAEGGINIFRPRSHAQRINHSCEKLVIPKIDEELFIEACKELVKIDRNWIPKKRGSSLYIRPIIYGTDFFLGVRPSINYNFSIMTSPVSSYYKEGLNPVKILVSSEYVRAVKGGLGSAKTPANYAASLYAQAQAKDKGYTQVLWLDGITHELVDEVGTMNIFFFINNELITPPLVEGTILAGITRDSVLTLARSWGMKVSEHRISIEEVVRAYKNGKLQEVFGTGTAAVISPVGELTFKDVKMIINGSQIGALSKKLYDEITGIQYGDRSDPFEWVVRVE